MEICGHWMPKAGARCARKSGHPGKVHHPGVPCAGGCGQLVSVYISSTGYCRACYTSRSCGCGRPLYLRNKTDLCTPCKGRVLSHIRRLRLSELKLEAGCADCAFRGSPYALEFDHVRGVKVRVPTSLRNGAWDKVLAEVAKCEVVCANCHAVRTATRLRAKFSGYDYARGSSGYLARRARIAEMKVAAGCVDCGYRAAREALQFDHVAGVKNSRKHGVGQMQGSAWADVTAEIAKCEVRCANCHAVKTVERAGWNRTSMSTEDLSDASRAWVLGKAREAGLVTLSGLF